MMETHVVHILVICHDDKSEATRLSGGGILDDAGLLHRPKHIELALQFLQRDAIRTGLTTINVTKNTCLSYDTMLGAVKVE